MAKYTRQQTEKLIKDTKEYKKTKKTKDKKINGEVIHILMWLAYRFDLAEGEMRNLQIKDLFQKTTGGVNVLNLTIYRKTKREKPTKINVKFNADETIKLKKFEDNTNPFPI